MITLPFFALIGENDSDININDNLLRREYFTVFLADEERVVQISASEYLFGVVAAEISFIGEDAAVKAQIVASYTFALYRKNTRDEHPDSNILYADLSSDSAVDQAFFTREQAREHLGDRYDESRTRFVRLMQEVAGLYLSYNNQPIFAAYHAISGGQTESAYHAFGREISYLQPVESIGDLLAPGYLSTVEVSAVEFVDTLQKMTAELTGENFEEININSDDVSITPPTLSDSGYVLAIDLAGNTFTGAKVRRFFGLRSSNFDLSRDENIFTFTVRGHGHGAGMSQLGARHMADQGSCFREILKWFYNGVEIAER